MEIDVYICKMQKKVTYFVVLSVPCDVQFFLQYAALIGSQTEITLFLKKKKNKEPGTIFESDGKHLACHPSVYFQLVNCSLG